MKSCVRQGVAEVRARLYSYMTNEPTRGMQVTLLVRGERPWRNWIAHRSSEPRVVGSNPTGRAEETRRGSDRPITGKHLTALGAIW